MDWQTLTIAGSLVLAGLYLAWNYHHSRKTKLPCAKCVAHHKLSVLKQRPTRSLTDN